MGRWTPNYVDNVLNTKVSALITGAINRAAVEKETTITYDEFVNELDTGDSFTTSLVDILVKELAERHTRPFQQNERQLIAPRTAERLLTLANQRLYRGERHGIRNHAGRRTYNLAEFMHLPTAEIDADEEDFANLMDVPSSAAEGAGFNNDLFDAYGSNGNSWPSVPRRVGTTPSPPLEDEPLWRTHGPLTGMVRHSTWEATPGTSSNSATSIARHSSIRRPPRRMVDFNDWTARRRSTIRDGNHGEGSDRNSPFSLGSGSDSPQTVRRFFPTLSRRSIRPSEYREEGRVHPSGDAADRERSPSVITRATESYSSSGSSGVMPEDRPLPRLRRRDVRLPEMFYTNRYSWPTSTSSSRPSEQMNNNAHSSLTRSPSLGPSELHYPLSPPTSRVALSEPVGYPTPGSIENEPTSV
ncbi:hypothetical protein Ac2012v2_004344 [Leucoagaricus gongylophorus]